MKKVILFFLIALAAIGVRGAESIVLDGIRYTLQKDNTLQCEAADKKALVDVEIPETVRLKGIDYYVGSIKRSGFSKCVALKSIIIPNSVKKIGWRAFDGCKALESVVMPDDAEAEIFEGNYGFGRIGIFSGCKSLANVSGHEVPYPRYVVYDAFFGCEDTPFFATIVSEGSANLTARTFKSDSFSDFAASRLKRAVEEWQVRKPYETMAQWNSRVNDDTRRAFIDETVATLRHEYISKYSPRNVRGKLGDYVRDFEFFSVELGGSLGTVYASVPAQESAAFREAWADGSVQPVYGIMDDNLAVLSCTFNVAGRQYNSARSYAEDDFTPLAVNITPLSAIREYETATHGDGTKAPASKQFTPDAIDLNIPASEKHNSRTFAVIIGNENYQRVAPVDFAANDARIFAKYCERTLGIPETNIRTYYDATYGDILAAMRDIRDIASAYNGDIKVLVYYAGHGVPDESNRNAYLLPVDASGNDIDACYPMTKLYDELGALNAEAVVAFIDACFSGSVRGEGMLASARGIRLKPRDLRAAGNLVVLSAASGDQSALPYEEKGHGIFTYYLLEKLNSTKGETSIGELADYISTEVARQSVVVNRKLQSPTVTFSPSIASEWRDVRIK